MRGALGLAVALAATAAHAHQSPSVDRNNRYLKVTLLPEAVRLTLTLLYGERPAVTERRSMDRDGDGRITDDEAHAFGEQARQALAPDVTLDGQTVTGAWKLDDVGLGTPAARGGAFAVDLVLEVSYADPRADEHTLGIDDAAALPLAGEVELRIQESPGVRVLESHLTGEAAGIELTYAFAGNAAARGERAVTTRFAVAPELRPKARGKTVILLAVIAAMATATAAAIRLARRPQSS